MASQPGYPKPSRPQNFLEIERRFVDLQVQYKQGSIDTASYQAAVQSLTTQDVVGTTWWYGGEPPRWQWFDGTQWIPGEPAAVGLAEKPKRKLTLVAAIIFSVLAIICLILSGVIVGEVYREFQAMPKVVEGVESLAAVPAALPLSADQQDVRTSLGPPEAFTILFYEEALEDGSIGDVRFEVWSYYSDQVEYTFINGEQVGEDPIDIELGELVQIPYAPEQFRAYMSLDEVLASAGLDAFMVVPLEKELVEGGEVFYADELTFGLKDDELLYIEALALEVEG